MRLLWAAIFIPEVNLLIRENERERERERRGREREREREREATYPQIHHHLEREIKALCQQTEVSLLHPECLEEKLKPVGRKSCLFLSSP